MIDRQFNPVRIPVLVLRRKIKLSEFHAFKHKLLLSVASVITS